MKFLLACLLFLWLLAPTRADRDIVYSARYYTPPGSHRTSHFHLYRINPDGTGRTQLTFGNSDDSEPQWSPDGRHLLFQRDEEAVCVADANGRRLRTLVSFGGNDFVTNLQWSRDGRGFSFVHNHYVGLKITPTLWLLDTQTGRARRFFGVTEGLPSPDGHWLFLDDGTGQRLLSLSGATSVPLKTDFLGGPVWLDSRRLMGVLAGSSDAGPVTLQEWSRDGHLGRRLLLRFPKAGSWVVQPPDDNGWLLPSPRPGTVIYALNEHNSTVGTLAAFFRVSLPDGAARFLAEGQFLAWSPDGRRFCTAPGRDLWTYPERTWAGRDKWVWAAPLRVGTGAPGKLKTITPGLVWVTGADWRAR